jgi:glycosyltransferase involved in cell wall biosynthesis
MELSDGSGGQLELLGVLVTFRRPDALREMLSVLCDQTRKLDRLFVVDNEPTTETGSVTREFDERLAIEYVAAEGNIGPAGGIALGATRALGHAHGDGWLLTLDDDDPPYFPDSIERLAAFAGRMASEDPSTGGVGMTGGRFDLRRARIVRIGDDELSGPVSVDHIPGGFLPLYRMSAMAAVGPPLPELFFGLEELEYGLRLTGAGFHLYADGDHWSEMRADKRARGVLSSDAVVTGPGKRGGPQRQVQPTWRRYYSMRNLIYLLRRRGAHWTAARVSLSRGIARPMLSWLSGSGDGFGGVSMSFRAVLDGWIGRMGRTVDPSDR